MAKRAEGERTVLVVVLMLGEEAVEVVMGELRLKVGEEAEEVLKEEGEVLTAEEEVEEAPQRAEAEAGVHL